MEQSGELTVYRGCTPVLDVEYGTESDQSPADVIVEAVATAAGVDPIALPPLYEFVDLDAIDALFADHDGVRDAEALLSFKVDTWNVFIRDDGRIRVCDATQRTDPVPVFASGVA